MGNPPFTALSIPNPAYIVTFRSNSCPQIHQCARFIFQRPALECETVMLNINYGHNRALREKCRRLKEYAVFVNTVRENLKRPLPLREAVSAAVDTCIENNVLRDILLEQKAEVIQKKLAKGKSVETIAGELEVDTDTVRSLRILHKNPDF